MSENKDFDFCPRCGALMQNGVCRSCGYTVRQSPVQPSVQENYGQSSYSRQPYMQGAPYVHASERKKGKKGPVIVLSIIGAVILITALIMAVVFFGNALSRIPDTEDYYYDDGYEDYYNGDYYGDYDSSYYVPSEDDAYYEEIVDSTRTDLEYGISWIVDSITPDDSEDNCTYYSTYPLLSGDGDYQTVNERIREMALQYRDSYRDYAGGCTTLGYVTYMDETQISVVFQYSLYEDNGTLPRITALNFNLETGEEILPEQMTEIDDSLVMRFRAQNTVQNGTVEYVDNASDEELLALLSDPSQSVYFYSPVGLEVGFNYESEDYSSGWVSVTLKEQAL